MQSVTDPGSRAAHRTGWMTKRHYALAAMLLFVLLARYMPGVGEWYATSLYPPVSYSLSAIFSLIPFSLEEWVVVFGGLFLVINPVVGALRRIGALRIISREIELIAWLYVWFYLGWGCNYYRSDFYVRGQIRPVQTDKDFFQDYLAEFAIQINECYPSSYMLTETEAEALIKQEYQKIPSTFGLCRPQPFQHPKYVLFNRLYSAVGVLGYMGPFFCESQLNLQLLPEQYAFTYAHELAHLMGVSSEAEANYWAFRTCTSSENRLLQYSGYYGLLPYLANNARALLSAEEYNEWIASLNPQILYDLKAKSDFWQSQQIDLINDAQEWFYDCYLKSNHIPSGKANYSQVVQMVLSVRKNNEEM